MRSRPSGCEPRSETRSLSLCVLREGQFVVAVCAGSGRLRDDADEWHDATVSGMFSERRAAWRRVRVTESLCGENTPSDLAAIMLGDFTKLRKATGNFAMSVRPSA